MLSLLRGHVSDALAPLIFAVMFLVIVGGALWLTPRLAKWLDKKDAANKSYYDGMLTEDPNAPEDGEEKDGKSG
ncbi:MAG: hypothetical protein K2O84_00170 [Oscillospiraceae bacterium]|nr:hypothetical protein [Oscillospiraceae bacterium]